MKKHEYFEHEIIDYAADMTIALAYYKSEDDWIDDHNQTKRVYKNWLKSSFNKDIANLVEGVTKLSKIQLISEDAKQAQNFQELVLATSKDIRILMIKVLFS